MYPEWIWILYRPLLRLSQDVKSWYINTLGQFYPSIVPDYRKLYDGTTSEELYGQLQRWQQSFSSILD
ncbi:hypothetical protein ACE3MQ_17830 [Paenibacillus lentus]